MMLKVSLINTIFRFVIKNAFFNKPLFSVNHFQKGLKIIVSFQPKKIIVKGDESVIQKKKSRVILIGHYYCACQNVSFRRIAI